MIPQNVWSGNGLLTGNYGLPTGNNVWSGNGLLSPPVPQPLLWPRPGYAWPKPPGPAAILPSPDDPSAGAGGDFSVGSSGSPSDGGSPAGSGSLGSLGSLGVSQGSAAQSLGSTVGGLATGSNIAGSLIGIGTGIAGGRGTAAAVGTAAGSIVGTAIGGPLLGMALGWLGGRAGGMLGDSGLSPEDALSAAIGIDGMMGDPNSYDAQLAATGIDGMMGNVGGDGRADGGPATGLGGWSSGGYSGTGVGGGTAVGGSGPAEAGPGDRGGGPNGGGYSNDSTGGSGGGDAAAKIICNELHRQGLMPNDIWAADERFGEWLAVHDPAALAGYHAWAPWVVRQISGTGLWADFVRMVTLWIVTPWSRHMAYKMGALPEDNHVGRCIMAVGRLWCRVIGASIVGQEHACRTFAGNS